MSQSLQNGTAVLKDKAVALDYGAEDKRLVLALVRDAIVDSGWKHDAVAAAMSEASGRSIDGPYLSKMLAGDKAFPADLLRALPDDIEAIFAGLYAETFGLIVVRPAQGTEAVRHLVSGLFGVLAPQLPAKASAMVKAATNGNGAKRKVG